MGAAFEGTCHAFQANDRDNSYKTRIAYASDEMLATQAPSLAGEDYNDVDTCMG